MFDLHVHSVFSDGELLPSEILRRMQNKGILGCAITDHADFTNISTLICHLSKLREHAEFYDIEFLIGVELTHIPPRLISKAVELSWREGAEIVIVHGETIVEPVAEGTNLAAIESEASVLAHPGLIKEKEVELAAENGICLEISARRGHCLTNGHVAKLATELGADLVFGSDSHAPSDILGPEEIKKVSFGCGAGEIVLKNTEKLFRKLKRKV